MPLMYHLYGANTRAEKPGYRRMNDMVNVEGELDLGHSSYWPPGETVGVSGDEEGSEEYEHWPDDIDPQALTDKQRAIVKAAFSNPAQSADAIADEVGCSMQYVTTTLKKEALVWYQNVFKDKTNADKKGERDYECPGCGRVFQHKAAWGGHKSGCDELQDGSEASAVESDTPREPEEPEGNSTDRDELDVVIATIKKTAVNQETIDAVELIESYL